MILKFTLLGDETISIISDTWSTDVLASDSETIDANDSRHEQQTFVPGMPLVDSSMQNPLLDISETQSESAWSTDVLTSDTERLTEVDNDDIASVARSDDASSVARSDDVTRSEVDDSLQQGPNTPDRRLSNPSFQYVNNLDLNFVEYRRLDATQEQGHPRNANVKQKESRNVVNRSVVSVPQSSIVFNEFNHVSGGGEQSGGRSMTSTESSVERRCSDGIAQLTINDENLLGMFNLVIY